MSALDGCVIRTISNVHAPAFKGHRMPQNDDAPMLAANPAIMVPDYRPISVWAMEQQRTSAKMLLAKLASWHRR